MGHSWLRSVVFVALWTQAACQRPDPESLLRQMQVAVRDVETVAYSFRYGEIEQGREVGSPVTGTVVLRRLDLSGGRYLARVEAMVPSAGESSFRVTGVVQEEDVYLSRSNQPLAYHSSLYAFGSQLRAQLGDFLMYPFFDPESLSDEIGSEAEWEGRADIGDESCDLVRVSYDDDPEDSRWCVGSADWLPRRLEWLEGDSGTRLDLLELEPKREVSPRTFSFEVPEGQSLSEYQFGLARGAAMPDLALELEDQTIRLGDLRGNVVVLEFWATWCPPCRSSLESLERTSVTFTGRPVRFFAVNTMEDLEPGDPVQFMSDNDFTTEVVLSGDELHGLLAPGNLPAVAVLDPKGRAFGVGLGFHGEGSRRHLEELIEEALEAGAG